MAGLDLYIVATHIRCGYGFPNSSQMVDPPPPANGKSMVDQATVRAEGTPGETFTPGQAWLLGVVLTRTLCDFDFLLHFIYSLFLLSTLYLDLPLIDFSLFLQFS